MITRTENVTITGEHADQYCYVQCGKDSKTPKSDDDDDLRWQQKIQQ